jgi:hypothetical protein
VAVTVQTCIPQEFGSNFSEITAILPVVFLGFLQFLHGSFGIMNPLSHAHFLRNPIRVIIRPSSYNSTP